MHTLHTAPHVPHAGADHSATGASSSDLLPCSTSTPDCRDPSCSSLTTGRTEAELDSSLQDLLHTNSHTEKSSGNTCNGQASVSVDFSLSTRVQLFLHPDCLEQKNPWEISSQQASEAALCRCGRPSHSVRSWIREREGRWAAIPKQHGTLSTDRLSVACGDCGGLRWPQCWL